MPNDRAATALPPTSFLVFSLGGRDYGVAAATVRELCAYQALDPVAADGALVAGVAMSRGVILPVVDMRAACAGQPVPLAPHTDVIVLQLASGPAGLLVDAVGTVVTLAPAQIAPWPGAAPDYLIGIGQTADGRQLILVDMDRLMAVQRAPGGARAVA